MADMVDEILQRVLYGQNGNPSSTQPPSMEESNPILQMLMGKGNPGEAMPLPNQPQPLGSTLASLGNPMQVPTPPPNLLTNMRQAPSSAGAVDMFGGTSLSNPLTPEALQQIAANVGGSVAGSPTKAKPPNLPFDIAHPNLSNFLTAMSQGFGARLAPGAFAAQQQQELQRQAQLAENQREQLRLQQEQQKQALEDQHRIQAQQLDIQLRGGKEVPLNVSLGPAGGPPIVSAPSDAIQVGNKYYRLPEAQDEHKGQTAVPARNPIAQKFLEESGGKPDANGLVYMDSGLLKYYGDTQAQQDKNLASKELLTNLNAQAQAGQKQVSDFFKSSNNADPFAQAAFQHLFDTARETDKKTGNSSEMKQAWSKWLDYVNTNSPAARADKVADQLQQRKDLATFVNNLHEGPEVNSEEVNYWTKQVAGDAKNFGLIKNKKLAEAVDLALAKQGMNVNQIDAQTRDAAVFSQKALTHIADIKDSIAKLEKGDQLGVFTSRWNSLLNSTVGTGNAEFNKLRTNFALLRSAMARVHGGARGGSSPYMMDYMKSLVSAEKMDPNILKSGLGVIQDWLEQYASMAPTSNGTAGGSTTPLTGTMSVDDLVKKYGGK